MTRTLKRLALTAAILLLGVGVFVMAAFYPAVIGVAMMMGCAFIICWGAYVLAQEFIP